MTQGPAIKKKGWSKPTLNPQSFMVFLILMLQLGF